MPRFLVVDDDPATIRGMARLLAGDGHDVSAHSSGAAAVDALARESFDAVVTDLEMPRVDGHAVVRAAREHQPHACLVVTTTQAGDACEGLLDAGARFIADKPVEYEVITREIAHCRARGVPATGGRCHMRSRHPGHRLVPLRRK